jgi:hypothetical protein
LNIGRSSPDVTDTAEASPEKVAAESLSAPQDAVEDEGAEGGNNQRRQPEPTDLLDPAAAACWHRRDEDHAHGMTPYRVFGNGNGRGDRPLYLMSGMPFG